MQGKKRNMTKTGKAEMKNLNNAQGGETCNRSRGHGLSRLRTPMRPRSAFALVLSLFLGTSLLVLVPAWAGTWWDNQWRYRIRVNLDTTQEGADIRENLEEVPILIRLHSGNFNFGNAKEDGSDLRFVSSDDKTVLKHHIEKFDSLEEIGLVWVKLPRLSGATDQDFVWMYYGNPDAVGGQDEHGTYDVRQALVYHFEEIEGAPRDSSFYKNHASDFKGIQGLPSAIGNGVALNGAEDKIRVQPSESLEFGEGFTFSAWIRIAQPQADAYVYFRQDGDRSFVIGIEGTKAYFRAATEGGTTVESERSVDLTLGTWHLLAVTAESAGRFAIFVDGLQLFYTDAPFRIRPWKTGIVLGGTAEGNHAFVGEVDEIQLSSTARSAGWIRAAWASQAPEGPLCHLGVEEAGAAASYVLLTFTYLKTVVRYITLDGWVIIGIIAMMSMLCWIVFIGKTAILGLVERENKAFLTTFQEARDPMSLALSSEDFQNSTLYPLYCAGRDLISAWIGNPPHTGPSRFVPKRVLNALRAALDKGVVEETRRLNSWLLHLTMTIAGAPMLGLLGTVWGVMNTFASMAESGESNIMAIAPGVSSALATTVAGLVAAIPALFCYNYLTNRVKGITVDTNVFADLLALRVEEALGEQA